MKTYKVKYSGNSTRFKNFEETVLAASKRDAVETVFQTIMDENYFPQEDGSIKDCDGEEIATPTDETIDYDGGHFYAEIMKTYDVHFNDSTDSNSKGFEETLDYCKDYIQMHNGTNESYFADYKGGTVSIVCNETGETVYEEIIK